MERITFKQLLNRIGSQHFEQKTWQYIQDLEAVVAAVKKVEGIENLKGGEALIAAIKALEKWE
jgi:hypothetical protein